MHIHEMWDLPKVLKSIIETYVRENPDHVLWHLVYKEDEFDFDFETDVLTSCQHRRDESIDEFVSRLLDDARRTAERVDIEWDDRAVGLRSSSVPDRRWYLT